MLGKIEGRRRKEGQRMRWLNGITDPMDMSLSKPLGDDVGQGSLARCSLWVCKELDRTERLSNNNDSICLCSALSKKYLRSKCINSVNLDILIHT